MENSDKVVAVIMVGGPTKGISSASASDLTSMFFSCVTWVSPLLWLCSIVSTGTRFRPLSFNVPKPLFPLAGQPMIHHPISACKRVCFFSSLLVFTLYMVSGLILNTGRKFQFEFSSACMSFVLFCFFFLETLGSSMFTDSSYLFCVCVKRNSNSYFLSLTDTQFGSNISDRILWGARICSLCFFDFKWDEIASKVTNTLCSPFHLSSMRFSSVTAGSYFNVLQILSILDIWRKKNHMVQLVAFTASEMPSWKTAQLETEPS